MRQAGASAVGTAIVAAVLIIACTILLVIHAQVRRDRDRADDVRNMRKVYVAAMLYEEFNDGLLPLSLDATQNEVGGVGAFLASNDPNQSGSHFPRDPAFPEGSQPLSYRISFTYLPQWLLHKKYLVKDWRASQQQPDLGLIACYWYGAQEPKRPDGLDSQGEVTRINMDGSAKIIVRPHPTQLLDGATLFGPQSVQTRQGG
jgi:hypothetical protein